MAKTDRNVEIMRNVAGTTSLITDYDAVRPTFSDVTQLSRVIEALRKTSNVDYEKLVEELQGRLKEETNPDNLQGHLIDFGFKCGEIELAKVLLPILENLQKQH